MLHPQKIPAERVRKGPLTRDRMIKLLESNGVKEIEGKALEDCYTFQLKMVACRGKSSKLRFV